MIDQFELDTKDATTTLTAAVSGPVTEVTIDWGDGETENINEGFDAISQTHQYDEDGNYTVTLTASGEENIDPADEQKTLLIDTSSTDADEDGLSKGQEEQGWTVSYQAVSSQEGANGKVLTCSVASPSGCPVDNSAKPILPTSDPEKPDTDGDGLTDFEELKLGTHPRVKDTDGDGIDDAAEQMADLPVSMPSVTSPIDADSDNDRLADGYEAITGWTVTVEGVSNKVYSNPTKLDTDGDLLSDAGEVAYGTNPNNTDTDNDGSTDKQDIDRGRNPRVWDRKITIAYKEFDMPSDDCDSSLLNTYHGAGAGDYLFWVGIFKDGVRQAWCGCKPAC